MPGNGGVYAVRRRKKPVQKIAKPRPVKTNPSKRHRDRLNVELDHLTNLLPLTEEVRGRLDKLSVLRLSVAYLKVKSFFQAALQHQAAPPAPANGRSAFLDGISFSEGELLLQALNGFVLVVAADGTVFYASPTVQDFLGFHQSDVVHQSVYDLVHMDDRDIFRCQLHFSFNPNDSHADAPNGPVCDCGVSADLLPQYLPPENSSFLERGFCCRLRCLLDNASGFLALNFSGRLKYLHLRGSPGAGGIPAQLALFAIATPLQPPSVMEIRTKTLIFQTKHSMDFAPLGIDTRGKLALGYSEIELVTTRSGYQFLHAADMMYCADNHLRMMKTGDTGFTFFRLLTKTGHWLWVQATARVVFKGGRPDFIIARQKALTNDEGEEHLHQRRQQLPFNLATGEGVLYDSWMDAVSLPEPPGSGAPDATEPTAEKTLDPASVLGSLCRQDRSVYTHPQKSIAELPVFPETEDLDLEQPPSMEHAFLDSHALLSVPGQTHASPETCVAGDLTSDAMIDSLEQILGDIGHGSIEGFEVEEAELRNWELALLRMNKEKEEASSELNHIMANEIFSYVEDALRRETGQLVPDRAGDGVSVRGRCEQPATDARPGLPERTLTGKSPQCRNPHQGHACRLWPPSSCSYHHGNQKPDTTPHQDVASVQPELRGSPVWQPPPQRFHQHTPMPCSHTPGGTLDSMTPSLDPQTQRLSGSCMYERRDGHALNGPPSSSRGPTHIAPPHPGRTQPSGPHQPTWPDVANISLVHLGGDDPPGHGSLQSSFFCWSGEAQIPRAPLNGAVDPFSFAALPTGNANLSQDTGS
ncbi:aryl hydrocarbon receptor-like [Brachionichthys hirsutus]|uniref:aryl hydrocarbon receptor-like n=1 Tax=Brachionichthys hirsutus TaxID=412623 RepID=UPI003604FF5A